jgi:hypothetical protein
MEEKKEIVKWLADSKEDKPYPITTWYRCVKIQEFVEKVEKEHKIVGVVFSGNNLGFILDKNE